MTTLSSIRSSSLGGSFADWRTLTSFWLGQASNDVEASALTSQSTLRIFTCEAKVAKLIRIGPIIA
jgi:hypothetical protein